MLSKLLKSVARKKILEIFISNSRQKYYLRELANMISYSPGSLQRELAGLVEDGILEVEAIGNMKFFSLNAKSPLIKEIQRMLEKPQKREEPKGDKKAKTKQKAHFDSPVASSNASSFGYSGDSTESRKSEVQDMVLSQHDEQKPHKVLEYPEKDIRILNLEKPNLEKPKLDKYNSYSNDDDGITLNIE